MTLDAAYNSLLTAETDMRAHVPPLRKLAANQHVVEFGTRRGVSTVALLAGRPLSLITYDMVRTSDVDGLEKMADEAGVPFDFILADVWLTDSIPDCDLVFVDWLHHREAVLHSCGLAVAAGATTMAFHDTTTFRHRGDVGGTKGVYDGILEFLAANPNWKITYESDKDEGFTVIQRP